MEKLLWLKADSSTVIEIMYIYALQIQSIC